MLQVGNIGNQLHIWLVVLAVPRNMWVTRLFADFAIYGSVYGVLSINCIMMAEEAVFF
jgi:hypothetical protein